MAGGLQAARLADGLGAALAMAVTDRREAWETLRGSSEESGVN
jgi:hypothetical protein